MTTTTTTTTTTRRKATASTVITYGLICSAVISVAFLGLQDEDGAAEAGMNMNVDYFDMNHVDIEDHELNNHRGLSLASSYFRSSGNIGNDSDNDNGSELSGYSFNSLRKSYFQTSSQNQQQQQQPSSSSLLALTPPLPTDLFQTNKNMKHIETSRSQNPNDYAYLIIHYHKTGHDLSRSLRNLLNSLYASGPKSNDKENAFGPRLHNEVTKCPTAMNLKPGEIVVQAAPNFFCDASVLAELLLSVRDERKVKRGVKVIHLVRNPFTMAVSNFNYHAQYPTPEPWVRTIDPCANELFHSNQFYPDLILPTLFSPTPLNNPQQSQQQSSPPPIITQEQFQTIHTKCKSLYRTKPRLLDSSFYTHLRHLHPQNAILLATIHMMTQGASGGDILRMANNILKLRQVTQLLQQMNALHHIPAGMEKIQVLTMSMDDFITHPKEQAEKFLDFMFDNGKGNVMPKSTRSNIVNRYVQEYLIKMHAVSESVGPGVSGKDVDLSTAQANHVTGEGANSATKEEFIGYLRGDEVVGGVLGRVEELVEVALRSNHFDVEMMSAGNNGNNANGYGVDGGGENGDVVGGGTSGGGFGMMDVISAYRSRSNST